MFSGPSSLLKPQPRTPSPKLQSRKSKEDSKVKSTFGLLAALFAGGNSQEWETIVGGQNTDCISGDFSFFVRQGSSNNLLVEYEGGGGCWDESTCSQGLAKEEVDVGSTLEGLNGYRGIQDHFNPRNTFANWTHVYVPYCTADIHVGSMPNNAYGFPHVGLANGFDVFAWVLENVESPQKVMVTGCSAGGYGAQFWSPRFQAAYADSKQYVFNDSGNGVQSEGQYTSTLDHWNFVDGLASEAVPAYSNLDFSWKGLPATTSDPIVLAANQYPDAVIASYTTNADFVQALFYGVGGGDSTEWTRMMRGIVGDVERRTSNTAVFIAPGDDHCIIVGNDYYSKTVNGINLVQWLDDVVNDREYARRVDCADSRSC